MSERVRPIDLGVQWDPNAPEAVLIAPDDGPAVLALNAHRDDADGSCVVLHFAWAMFACSSAPNDEAISGHRLWRKGLSAVTWAGAVEGSAAAMAVAAG